MHTNSNSKGGFSLMEVMLAMVILTLIAMGISQGLVSARSISETNIREVTANAVASGYLEQMKAIEYSTLMISIRDPNVPVPTVLSLGAPDPLYLDQWVTKSVVIDEDPITKKERRMPMHVRLELEDLEPSGNGTAIAIALFFAWEDAKTGKRHERALRTVKSLVDNT